MKRKVQRIEIPEMSSIIRGIVRGTNKWGKDKYWNLEVPTSVQGMDLSKYDVEKFYDVDNIIKQVSELRCERVAYIEKFNTLDKAIINAAKTM